MMNLIAYADGETDLIGIAETVGADALELAPLAQKLAAAGLLEEAAPS